jgi:hypothetical protein
MQYRGSKVSIHWHPPKRKSLHTGYSLDSVFRAPLKKNVPLSNDSFFSPVLDTFRRKFFRVRQGDNVGFDPAFVEIKSGYVDGYFQSERYFCDIRDQIKNDFLFPKISGDENQELLNWMSNRFVISIHIRGGDYLNRGPQSGDMGSVCGPEYYRSAIDKMQKQFPDASYLVFSDDFEYANHVMGENNFRRVDWNSGDQSWKDMALIARCDAHILANSSFSWWGSWLADSKLRIMPAPWFPVFADSFNKDIYLEDAMVLEEAEG